MTGKVKLPNRCCRCLKKDPEHLVPVRSFSWGTLRELRVPLCETCFDSYRRGKWLANGLTAGFVVLFLAAALLNLLGIEFYPAVFYVWIGFFGFLLFRMGVSRALRRRRVPVEFHGGKLRFLNPGYQSIYSQIQGDPPALD